MLGYWLLFFVPSVIALVRLRVTWLGWLVFATGITLFVGLRYQVGADWFHYLYIYFYPAQDMTFAQSAGSLSSPGYALLSWLAARLGVQVWFVNLCIAAIFTSGLITFCRRLSEPMLALAVSVPYGIIVFGMGYSKQAAAFGFELFALSYILKGRLIGPLFFILVATAFHKSAIIIMPILLLCGRKRHFWGVFWITLATIPLIATFIIGFAITKLELYMQSSIAQASSGAMVRVSMNALPAIVFLFARRRLRADGRENDAFFWISLLSLLAIPFVLEWPTATDRLSLYLMPIQLFVLSAIPGMVTVHGRTLIRAAIIVFYALVQFVWFMYGDHTNAWLPYEFWPFFGPPVS